jgi:hypothetical protein
MVSKWTKWSWGIFCGLTGSVAALFAKLAFAPKNFIYDFINFMPYGIVFEYIIRTCFVLMMIYFNLKMVEYKIRSFAAVGSSLTVVISFLANYFMGVICEMVIYSKFPGWNGYVGSLFCLAGIYPLMKGAKKLKRESVYSEMPEVNLSDAGLWEFTDPNTQPIEQTKPLVGSARVLDGGHTQIESFGVETSDRYRFFFQRG